MNITFIISSIFSSFYFFFYVSSLSTSPIFSSIFFLLVVLKYLYCHLRKKHIQQCLRFDLQIVFIFMNIVTEFRNICINQIMTINKVINIPQIFSTKNNTSDVLWKNNRPVIGISKIKMCNTLWQMIGGLIIAITKSQMSDAGWQMVGLLIIRRIKFKMSNALR